jgi:hypothetical protein
LPHQVSSSPGVISVDDFTPSVERRSELFFGRHEARGKGIGHQASGMRRGRQDGRKSGGTERAE